MILPDHMLRAIVTDGKRIVEPFHERTVQNGMSFGLSIAGYDVRCKQDIVLASGDFSLGSTVERFTMPSDVIGVIHDKSTWARRGLSVYNTVAEPGWSGWLTLELANHGPDTLTIKAGDPIGQVLFHRLAASPEVAYSGKYSDQPDEPVPARVETGVPA